MKSHGTIAGIPYEFRVPTPQRIRERIWNPDDPRIFTPHLFGVGWTINLPSLRKRNEAAYYVALALYVVAAVNTVRSLLKVLGRLRNRPSQA
jgi:hypothetical protein